MNQENNHTDMDIQVTAKKDELSLKAKGAGLLILIAMCIVGIILLSLKMADMEKGTILFAPLLFLLYITYNLIATLDAVLGITVRYRDD
ncbi:hypothetical protein ACH518_06590 [Methylomonas sp. HW2-6]|uniref:hypothetical protein n=1 Tax=Methylomonas sp. HW2-6 TaxID=3376687 RepID=UPI0040427E2F